MWNKFICIGNIGKDDADLRYTASGQPVSNFSLATTSGWGDSKTTLWIRCTIWGKLAESLTPYLTKGKQVLVEGELQVDTATGGPRVWTDKSGNARASFEITARAVVLLGSKSVEPEDTEDEIPF